jgi:hypothetical protein
MNINIIIVICVYSRSSVVYLILFPIFSFLFPISALIVRLIQIPP